MDIKFNSLTFDLKDLLLICGFVAGYFNFKSEQKEMYNGGWKSVAVVQVMRQQPQMTNESCLQIVKDFSLNATAKGVDVVNSLESTNFFMNKARICDALQK